MEIYGVLGVALLALVFAFVKARWVSAQEVGTDEMAEIGANIREGAMAYLSRQYRVLIGFVVVVAVLLAIGYGLQEASKAIIAVSFLCGALCSGLAGFFGMRVATSAN